MNLKGINLVESNNRYMLVDYSARKPVIISKRVYDILSKIKNGVSIETLEVKYDADLIETVINTVNDMIQRGVIENTDKNFFVEGERVICNYKEQNVELLEGMIMVSQDCNMACTYCYGGKSGTYNQKGLMSIEMAERCFRYLLSVGNERKYQKVVFFGGEPLLNMDVIKHIVLLWEKIKQNYDGRKIYFTLTTNGLLLNSEIVKFFKDYNVGVSISLDGPREIHDANRVLQNGSTSFDKVMQAIELMRKCELPFSVRTTITKNIDFDKLYKFFEEQDFDIHTISLVDYPMVHTQREYQFDLKSYEEFSKKQREIVRDGCEDILRGKKNSFKAKQMSVSYHNSKRSDFPFICGAGFWLATFGLDGYIYPCNRLVGHEKFRIGDIDNGISKEKMVKILEEFLDASKNCKFCWAASHCKGRCFHQKVNEEGALKELPIGLCDIYRENIADSLFFTRKFKNYMQENKKDFGEAIIRYDADYMMKNYKK